MAINAQVNVNETITGGEKVNSTLARTARGLRDVDESAHRSSRSTTRLARESESAGRSFSAQAAGLGGLVAIYAGAAATIFALQQAFSALARAAQAEQIIKGTRTLAVEVGASGDVIINKLKEITQGQLTLAQAAETANIALSAGFSTKQIEQIADVSLKASRALGRNLTDAFTRLARGTAKLEPELLDELGIFTRLDPAVRKYAITIGKTATSLTNFEKRQAFVTAAIEEGQRKFNDIDVSTDSAQKSLEQFSASFIDLATNIGGALSRFIAPVADFLSKDLGNQLATFAIVASLALGKLGGVLAGATAGVVSFFDTLAQKVSRARGSAAQIEGITNELATLSQRAATPGTGGRVALSDIPSLKTADALLIKNTVKYLRDLDIESVKSAAGLGQLRDRLISARDAQQRMGTTTNFARGRLLYFEEEITRVNAQLALFGPASKLGAAAVLGLSRAVHIAGAAFSILTKGLGVVIGVLSGIQFILSFFNVDVFSKIAEGIAKISEESRKLTEALTGIVGASNNLSGLNKQLQLLGADDNRIKELRLEVTGFLEDVVQLTARADKRPALSDFFSFDRDVINGMQQTISAAQAQEIVIERVRKKISELQDTVGQGINVNKSLQEIRALEQAIKLIESGAAKLVQVFAELSISSGLSAAQLEKLRTSGILYLNQAGDRLNLSFDGASVEIGNLVGRYIELNKQYGDIAPNALIAANQLLKFDKILKSGNLTAEKASELVGGARTALRELGQQFSEGGPGGATKGAQEFIDLIGNLNKRLTQYLEVSDELGRIEKTIKNLNAAYSSQIKLLDQLDVSGIATYDADQKKLVISKSQEETYTNQLKILVNIAKEGSVYVDLQREGAELGTIATNKAQEAQTAFSAIAGYILTLPAALQKITLELDKQQTSLSKQLELQRAQIQVANIRLEEQIRQQTNTNILNLQNAQLETLNNQLQLQKVMDDAQVSALDNRTKLLEVQKSQIEAEQQLHKLIADEDILITKLVQSRERFVGQQRLKDLERFPGLTNQSEIDTERKKFIEEEYYRQLEILRLQRDIAEDDFAKRLKINLLEQRIAENNQRVVVVKAQQEQKIFDREIEVLKRKQAIDNLKRFFDTTNLEQEKRIVEAEYESNKLANEAARESALQQQKNLELQAEQLITQAKIFKDFADNNFEFIRQLRDTLKEAGNLPKDATTDIVRLNVDQSIKDAEALRDKITGVIGTINKIYNEKNEANLKKLTDTQTLLNSKIENAIALQKEYDKAQKAELDAKEKLKEATLTGRKAEIDLAEANLRLARDRRSLLFQEEKNAQIEYQNAIQEAAQNAADGILEVSRNSELLRSTLSDVSNAIQGELKTAFDDLSEAIIRGTITLENFKQGVIEVWDNILVSIGQATTNKLITEPINSFIGGLFGQNTPKGTEDDPINVAIVRSSIAAGFKGLPSIAQEEAQNEQEAAAENAAEIVQQSFFEKMKGSFSNAFDYIKSGLTKVFGQNGFFSNLFSNLYRGIASVIGSTGTNGIGGSGIAGFIGSFASSLFSASGGPIHKASGGLVPQYASGGRTKRDSVPAWLEPGEFVMSRKSVQAMGLPALQGMNRGSSSGGTPNVSVNITNSGTPQQTEGTPNVKFDGANMIVDVVLKDLRQNGPIRQGIRGLRTI